MKVSKILFDKYFINLNVTPISKQVTLEGDASSDYVELANTEFNKLALKIVESSPTFGIADAKLFNLYCVEKEIMKSQDDLFKVMHEKNKCNRFFLFFKRYKAEKKINEILKYLDDLYFIRKSIAD